MRLDDRVRSGWFAVEQGLRQGCVFAPLLFNIFFAVVINVTSTRFKADKGIMDPRSRSTIEGGRGCNIFSPVLRGNSTEIAPTGDIFDPLPGGMSWIRGKLADHVGDHAVLSPEEGVLVTSPGTESSYPRPPQSLKPDEEKGGGRAGGSNCRRVSTGDAALGHAL